MRPCRLHPYSSVLLLRHARRTDGLRTDGRAVTQENRCYALPCPMQLAVLVPFFFFSSCGKGGGEGAQEIGGIWGLIRKPVFFLRCPFAALKSLVSTMDQFSVRLAFKVQKLKKTIISLIDLFFACILRWAAVAARWCKCVFPCLYCFYCCVSRI